MMRPTPASPVSAVPVGSVPAVTQNPRVRVYPSSDGSVLLSGVTMSGRWVCEYRCLAEDFDERCVSAMERKVQRKEREWGEGAPDRRGLRIER